MFFDDFPRAFRRAVLRVSTYRGQREQPRLQDESDGGDGGFIKPFLHTDFDARAAMFGRDFNRQRGGESGQIAQLAAFESLQNARVRDLHRLYFITFFIEKPL